MSRALHHGGAISGFVSYVAWFPEDRLSIAVTVNTMGPLQPVDIVRAIAAVVHGEPARRTASFEGNPADYVGEYRGLGGFGDDLSAKVTADSAGALLLESPIVGPAPRPLVPVGGATFEVDDKRITFAREKGKATALRVDVVYATMVLRRAESGTTAGH